MLWEDSLVCKLSDRDKEEALQLEGAQPFNPRGTGKPMGNWVMLPIKQHASWRKYAASAYRSLQEEDGAR